MLRNIHGVPYSRVTIDDHWVIGGYGLDIPPTTTTDPQVVCGKCDGVLFTLYYSPRAISAKCHMCGKTAEVYSGC